MTSDTQRQSTMDLFAAFATAITARRDRQPPESVHEQTVAYGTLWCLVDITDPLAFDVLEEIHAERRRRQSAATREGRRS